MSRRDDLAYGDIPQRWDRDRFERFGRNPPQPASRYEEDYRYTERDRPGRRDITVVDHIEDRGQRGRFEERDRYWEEDRFTPSRPRRRTDRELFGDVDPRELAGMQLTPYRRKSISREEIDIDRRDYSRPGLLRRQSSLDTFDRRPSYVEREEYRVPPYTPVPLPIRRPQYREEYYYEPEDYREVEIRRERSVHRSRPAPPPAPPSEAPKSHKAKSHKTKSRATTSIASPSRVSSSSSSSDSYSEVDDEVEESITIVDTERKFKKGKTRMPKRLVRREAIMDLGYPFDEEEDFFVLRIALEKDSIDEVMRISETYKNGEKKDKEVIRYEDDRPITPGGEREEIIRTEWLNPPSVAGGGRRDRSASRHTHKTHHHHHHHSHSHSRSRAPSSPSTVVDERRTVIETSPPPAPPVPGPPPAEFYEERKTIIEERSPSHGHGGALVLQERESRSDRDIQSEIRALEAERKALRLEREAEEKREKALRLREYPNEEYQLVEYQERRPRDVLEIVERDRSPPRNVLRVEKDRKERRGPNPKAVAFAIGTLT